MSHERSDIAGAEGFHSLEGNMCGTVMRGADALPGSKATSHVKGSHRNLGDLVSGRRRRVLCVYGGPHWEGEEPKPMMHGHEKSDLVIVAMKPTNKAKEAHCGGVCGGERSGVGGAKGGGQGEYALAQHVLDPEPGSRDKRAGAYTATFAVTHPRWEPYAGKPHVRFWCSEASCHSSGCKSRQQRSPVAVVVIPSNGEGDRSVGSLEVKALGGRAYRSDPYRRASNLTGRSKCVNQEAPKDGPRVKRIAGGSGVPSCSELGEGHVDIDVLDQTMIELPGVREDGMLGRNGQRKPGTTRGSPRRSGTAKALRISRHAVKSQCARGWGGWG